MIKTFNPKYKNILTRVNIFDVIYKPQTYSKHTNFRVFTWYSIKTSTYANTRWNLHL